MEGITVISEEIMTEVPNLSMLVILFFIMLPGILFTSLLTIESKIGLSLLVFIVTIALTTNLYYLSKVPTGDITQIVTVDKSISVVDFYNSYEVVEYDGAYFTVIEK